MTELTVQEAHAAWSQRAFAGTAARLRRAKAAKKWPSRAMAKDTRAPERTRPFTQPKVEIMIAAAIARAPAGPKRTWATAVPTRSCGAEATPTKPSVLR